VLITFLKNGMLAVEREQKRMKICVKFFFLCGKAAKSPPPFFCRKAATFLRLPVLLGVRGGWLCSQYAAGGR